MVQQILKFTHLFVSITTFSYCSSLFAVCSSVSVAELFSSREDHTSDYLWKIVFFYCLDEQEEFLEIAYTRVHMSYNFICVDMPSRPDILFQENFFKMIA